VLDYLQGGFFQLPPACTELDMDVKVLSDYLYSGDEQSDFDVNEHPVEGHSKPWMQIDTLRLRIEDAKYSDVLRHLLGVHWAKFVNRFSKSTRLTLHCDFGAVNLENVRMSWGDTRLIEDLCARISLSHLRDLSISQWM
jgi:hypothetical protein